MIEYSFLSEFNWLDTRNITGWITFCIEQEERELGEVNFIFCDDDYLLEKNVKILKHNTLTDVISLDFCVGNVVSGDIYISIPRVEDNAAQMNVAKVDELHRVMIHGVLHLCGYGDKDQDDKVKMRKKEDYYLSLRAFSD